MPRPRGKKEWKTQEDELRSGFEAGWRMGAVKAMLRELE